MEKEQIKKVQFNTRIPEELKKAADTVAAQLGWSNEEIAKTALITLMGGNGITAAKRKLVIRVVKDLGLSFNHPDRQPDQALAA